MANDGSDSSVGHARRRRRVIWWVGGVVGVLIIGYLAVGA